MTRRKILWIVVLLALSAVMLSPWVTAPPSAVSTKPQPPRTAPSPSPPSAAEAPQVKLRVAAALGEAEFAALQKQNADQSAAFWNVRVELLRVDPSDAYETFSRDARNGTAADVMLMPGGWVKTFAVSGFLAPADGAFAGEALSMQFDALTAPLKWNGYIWGVPRDFDPYVLVWNQEALRAAAGQASGLPRNAVQWADLAEKSRSMSRPGVWLALDKEDPLSLLAWVEAVTRKRTDTVWEEASPWAGTPRGEALALLDRERDRAAFVGGVAEIAKLAAEGRAVAAVLPYSEARRLLEERAERAALALDRGAWQLPYVWLRGSSYTIYARTDAEEAANQWIAAMTAEPLQLANWMEFGKLPVNSSMYRSVEELYSILPGQAPDAFPYQPPAIADPAFPKTLERLASLWKDFAEGKAGYGEWNRRWPEVSADFELHR